MTTTQNETPKERALRLIHESIEHNILISRDNCVAVIFSDKNGEEGWRWISISDAAEDIVRQNMFEVLEEGIKRAKANNLFEMCLKEGVLKEEDEKIFSPWFHCVDGEYVEWASRDALINDLVSQETWLDQTTFNPRSEEYLRKWYVTHQKTRDIFPELHEMLFTDKDPTLIFSEGNGYHYAYYFNPDSNAGGTIVECSFDNDMAHRIKNGKDFINVVAERTQYLSDINADFFFNTIGTLLKMKKDMYIGSVWSEDDWTELMSKAAMTKTTVAKQKTN